MAKGRNQASDVCFREVGNAEFRSTFMLDPVDSPEVMLAVWSDRGARLTVLGSAGIIVRDDWGVEIEDIHRTVGTERDIDRAEPMIHRA